MTALQTTSDFLTAIPSPKKGEVWLVGAGLGDPALLTIKGLALLTQADVVVHDRLGCEEIVALLPDHIERIAAGKAPGESHHQESIQAILIREARADRAVVRLKGGDPLVFGRGMEELAALREAGVPCRMTPGISSSISTGVPVTHRNAARNFFVSTGHTSEGAIPRFGAADTHVFLMGVTHLQQIVAELQAAGVAAETPAALVESASTYRERVVRAPLSEIVQTAEQDGVRAPAVLIVGETSSMDSSTGPRRNVLVTSNRLPEILRAARPHADFLWRPLVRFAQSSQPLNWKKFHQAELLLFTNRPGVEFFVSALRNHQIDLRRVRQRIAALGKDTAEALAEAGLFADDFLADGRRDEAAAWIAKLSASSPSLYPCAEDSESTLMKTLYSQGVSVENFPVYRRESTRPAAIDWPYIHEVFFASPSAVRRFAAAFPNAEIHSTAALCIGQSTAEAAAELGFASFSDLTATRESKKDLQEGAIA